VKKAELLMLIAELKGLPTSANQALRFSNQSVPGTALLKLLSGCRHLASLKPEPDCPHVVSPSRASRISTPSATTNQFSDFQPVTLEAIMRLA